MGVKEVLADSPACRSLRVGDIITTINDWQVQHIKQPSTVLYCTALYCTVLYCTALYCTVLYLQ